MGGSNFCSSASPDEYTIVYMAAVSNDAKIDLYKVIIREENFWAILKFVNTIVRKLKTAPELLYGKVPVWCFRTWYAFINY